ncbi:hypothetical protein DH2020_005834 [Rehmannia glutinosa]|uniref:BRX domain-containing protein n=1 Tax=Rehmannia glutinosa TaxID=99300 RepID=A0ABR0XH52_REHGL
MEERMPRTPNTKDAVKSLTTQIKDMALKVSGAHKGKTEGGFKKGQRSYPDFDTISEGVPYTYVQRGSSSSTPAWDFTSTGHRATRPDSRFTAFGGDRTPGGLESVQSGEVVLEDVDQPKEWMAQVEPGVQITFVSLPREEMILNESVSAGRCLTNGKLRDGGARITIGSWSYTMFKDSISKLSTLQEDPRMEYVSFTFFIKVLQTPFNVHILPNSIVCEARVRPESPRMTPSLNKEWTPRYKPSFPPENLGNQHYGVGSSAYPTGGPKGEMSSMEASRTTTSSRDEASVSISNASDVESEWIEEDEPGVYITIRQLADGTRELRRVRFSREKFGEVHAKLWWETNRDRIQAQYLC